MASVQGGPQIQISGDFKMEMRFYNGKFWGAIGENGRI